jgi:hypothetical protein
MVNAIIFIIYSNEPEKGKTNTMASSVSYHMAVLLPYLFCKTSVHFSNLFLPKNGSGVRLFLSAWSAAFRSGSAIGFRSDGKLSSHNPSITSEKVPL